MTCPYNVGNVLPDSLVLEHDLCEMSGGMGYRRCTDATCPVTTGPQGAPFPSAIVSIRRHHTLEQLSRLADAFTGEGTLMVGWRT